MTYLPVDPPSSLRGNRTARPDHRSGFPCRAGHEEEGRITLGNNIKSPRLYRDRHSITPAYLGWQAARAQKCCALWCYPTSCGVVFSDSRRLFPPREPWEAEQCVDTQPRTRGGRTAYWCQRVVGPPSLNYTPKGDPRYIRPNATRRGRMDLHAMIIAGCLQSSCPLTIAPGAPHRGTHHAQRPGRVSPITNHSTLGRRQA